MLDLDALDRLAGTKRPWHHIHFEGSTIVGLGGEIVSDADTEMTCDNARLAVAAVNALPTLVAIARAAKAYSEAFNGENEGDARDALRAALSKVKP